MLVNRYTCANQKCKTRCAPPYLNQIKRIDSVTSHRNVSSLVTEREQKIFIMKHQVLLIAITAISAVLTTDMQAQGRGPGAARESRGGLGGPEGGSRPMPPLFVALDVDKNGELSMAEINNAVAVLKKMDADKDGKISMQEIRPRGDRSTGPGQRRGGQGRTAGERPRQGGRGGDPSQIVDRIMSSDANSDGKISKDELPERMQRLMEIMDENKDGFLTREEIESKRNLRRRGGQGQGPERGDRRRGGRPQ